VVTHQLQVERMTGKVRRSKINVLPLYHITRYLLYLVLLVCQWLYDVILANCASSVDPFPYHCPTNVNAIPCRVTDSATNTATSTSNQLSAVGGATTTLTDRLSYDLAVNPRPRIETLSVI